MRPLLLCCLLALLAFAPDSGSSGGSLPPPSGPYATQWKQIDRLLAQGRTATAAPLVATIYRRARQRGATPDYVRALLYQVRLLAAREENADEQAIALLEEDLRTATFPARPILHSLLAELYTKYLNQNRYRLYDRTASAQLPTPPLGAQAGANLATWDLSRLGAAIVRHYYQSVEDEPQKQLATTLAQLGELAVGGDAAGRALRPTLYDLLAQRAIAGLQNQELSVTRPEAQFQLTEPQLFGSAAEFAALRLPAPAADSLNGELHALRLLQRLTAARQRLTPRTPARLAALADVDLQRLDYLRRLSENTGLAELYEPALGRMAETYKSLPLSTEFIARQAEARRETDPVAAVALAQQAERRFPRSRGAARARALRQQIQRPELAFSAADIVLPNQPWRLDLTLRNVGELHARAYRISLKEWQSFNSYETRPEDDQPRYLRWLRTAPAATWTVPAPPQPAQFKEQKLAAAGPALPAGYYLVVISNQLPTPLRQKQPGTATAYAVLGASKLSALSRRDPGTGALRLLALHRQSGAPLAGIRAQATYTRYDRKARRQLSRQGGVGESAATGEVTLPAPANSGSEPAVSDERVSVARIWRGADTLALRNVGGYYQPSRNEAEPSQRQTFLFTDRAIYRPGQTLYFKGIFTENRRGQARLLPGQPVSVRLTDVNGQTVQTLPFTTSEFGSFHGSLVLPTGLLNGEMSLQTDHGSFSFAVEDYKRPTFLVQLDSVPGRPQLGQPLSVSGQARAYSGQATDGAKVSYRVTRRELWALFDYDTGGGRGRSIYPPRGGRETQEIAHGTATTDAEGRFVIRFTPPLVLAGPGRRGGWEPGYLFEITADVTDAAGETRTGTRSFPIGRNPLSLRLIGPDMADQQRLPPFTLLSTNATGEPLPAAGTLRLSLIRYRPNPPGVPGPAPETADNEAAPELVKTLPFDTKNGPNLNLSATLAALPTGRYRLEALAASADSARARLDFTLYDSRAATVPFPTPDWFVSLQDSVAPGQPAAVLLGSRAAGARILLEVERDGQLLRQEWLTLTAGEQRRLVLDSGPATAAGPLYIHTTQVRDNRLYRHDATVQVAEPSQPLRLSINTFRDRLLPGEKETWRLTIRQANGQPADAELLATLYDQSLDVFRPHSFMGLERGGSYYSSQLEWQGAFEEVASTPFVPTDETEVAAIDYPELNTWQGGRENYRGRPLSRQARAGRVSGVQLSEAVVADAAMAAPAPKMAAVRFTVPVSKKDEEVSAAGASAKAADATGEPKDRSAAPDLTLVPTRRDFRETAFWQPALRTDKNGDIVLEFQMPEAVTRWQLLALAHDKSLRSGQLARQLVTRKQVQITPNAPRFFRPGDSFTFQAKFSNLTDQAASGTAQLFLLDAATGQDITGQLLNSPAQQAVTAGAHQSAAVGWQLSLPPDFAPTAVTYRVVAQSQLAVNSEQLTGRKSKRASKLIPHTSQLITHTDGEENTLPVLPNRILVTESLPLPLAGAGTRTFELSKLTSTSSPTRRNHALTLELTANPAWLAVQSLPYLLEYPYEGSEQIFSRLYANLIAAHILKANPRLQTVLAEWQRQAQSGPVAQQNALAGKLAQNQELKNLLLQETPWVRDAQTETERLARLSTLFDQPRLAAETSRALAQLQRMQQPGGAWPWFERMPDDRYITQLIVAGLGKLRQLGVFDSRQDATAKNLLDNALRYVDARLADDYAALRRLKSFKPSNDYLSDLAGQALYARSFWPQEGVGKAAQPAYTFFRQQAAAHWLRQPRQLQAQLALAAFRTEGARSATAAAILRALRENALHSPELGMYWKEVRGGYYWREAPTETQAVLIEAFAEVAQDQKSVAEMKLWLLRQKQVQSWESTRATADACYALLLRGADLLVPAAPLQAQVGAENVTFSNAQAGTGYVKTTWPAAHITPVQGRITITKTDSGVAWGALYWQYFEDLDKVTPAATPLSVERQLFRETRTAGGPVLAPLTSFLPPRVGETVVVRLVLRTDRRLEYVHLKDQRAAGLEPLAPTSGYRYQGGLGYYESPRDAATNFFFAELPAGTHVLEYRLRAAQAGDFAGGLSQVQCLYAPAFGATSAGGRLRVGP
ncbi:alpha-2-macroglobulin [uncultured Hymenobacter sp.]|uniref:alpha-2-macroglobulin family protein n=1 Tax=uncultured Hymenobacter sp. TaxID=170016 RepID=UPI0035CC67F1